MGRIHLASCAMKKGRLAFGTFPVVDGVQSVVHFVEKMSILHRAPFRFPFAVVVISLTLLFLFRVQNQRTDVCPKDSPYLIGSTNLSTVKSGFFSSDDLGYFQKLYQGVVQPGGRYRPRDCTARYKVAIIVPYRDRVDNLHKFLIHMHPFLQRQYQVDYTIFVIEQAGTDPFNRGKLLNVGAVEALQMDPELDCFIFHDVDLLPEDDRNLYTCPEGHPIHMSAAVDFYDYQMRHPDLFGGVTAMTPDQFNLVNGFSNEFWGWGNEDHDMFNRVLRAGLAPIQRSSATVARYTMSYHSREKIYRNPNRKKLILKGLGGGHQTDGVSSLRYKRLELNVEAFYVHVVADLGKPSSEGN